LGGMSTAPDGARLSIWGRRVTGTAESGFYLIEVEECYVDGLGFETLA
jgi:hypothetical protein